MMEKCCSEVIIGYHFEGNYLPTLNFFSEYVDFSSGIFIFVPKIPNFRRFMDRTQVIDSIRQLAKTALPPESKLLLYGSQARGDSREGSDWDLLILLDKPTLTYLDYGVGYPFRCLGWDIDEEINPQVYSKKEWENFSYTPFYKNVEQDKIVLL